jgi:predicted RNA-binding Zn-ribbon protein involved in translation (DUF1610 family)
MLKLMQRGDPQVASLPLTHVSAAWPTSAVTLELNKTCEECGSTYHGTTSEMAALCPECAHHLYGYPNCEHRMIAGRCEVCGWDGSASDYILHLTGRGKTTR